MSRSSPEGDELPLVVINNFPDHHGTQLEARVAILEAQMENVMAQLDDLNALLDAIGSDVTSLELELIQLQQSVPPQVDLSGVIAKATAIRSALEVAAPPAAVNPTPPTPADPNASSSATDTSSSPADAGGSTTDTSGVIDMPPPDVQP